MAISHIGLGLETDQSLPKASLAPDRTRLANGYCHPLRSGPRNGIVRFTLWPSSVAHSGWAFATTPSSWNRGTSSGWTTWIWAMWWRWSFAPLAIRAASRASNASRTARSPIAWMCTWNPSASSRVTEAFSSPGSTNDMPRFEVGSPSRSRYGSRTPAVKSSITPSCMIFTVVARNRPTEPRARPATSSSICSSPRWRSHHREPTTRAVSSPLPAVAMYAPSVSYGPPTMASCHAVMPSECKYRWATRRPSFHSSSVTGGISVPTRSMAPPRVGLVQVALKHLQGARRWMHVRVLESRKQHPAVQIVDLGLRPDEVGDRSVGSHRDDASVLHGDVLGPGACGVDRVDGAAGENEVGRAVGDRVAHVASLHRASRSAEHTGAGQASATSSSRSSL